MSELKKVNRPVASVEEVRDLDATRPFHELTQTRGFQIWKQAMEGEISFIEQLSWTADADPGSLKDAAVFRKMGLKLPVNDQERFEAFKACRAVVNYMRVNLNFIEKEALKHQRLLDKRVEREKSNG